jgi:GNAT superfamily N-acetyltransferase
MSRLSKYVGDFVSFPRDARLAWQLSGLPGVWEEVAARSLYRVIRFGILWVIEHPVLRSGGGDPPTGVSVSPLRDESELTPIVTTRAARAIRRSIAGGAVVLVARKGDRPVGYILLSAGIPGDTEGLRLDLPVDAAYAWGLFVVLAERGRGIGTALASASINALERAGFTRMWLAVRVSNLASQNAIAKKARAGSLIVGRLVYLKLFTRFFARFHERRTSVATRAQIREIQKGGGWTNTEEIRR